MVNKSTVPVGSANMVEQVIGRSDIGVVSNPEFLREGTAVPTASTPTASSSAPTTPRAAAKVGELFSSTRAPLIVTDATTSETIKYASNAFLATKLSFVNALAGLCEEVGADARDVLLGLGYDKRIGFEFLRPGPGLGRLVPAQGHPRAPAHRRRGGLRLLAPGRRHRLQRRAAVAGGGQGRGDLRRFGRGATVGVWGLTFKANTDDRRDSPSLQIAHRLVDLGATVQAFDPTVDAEMPTPPTCTTCSCGPTPTRRPPGPGSWWSSPSGTSSAGSTSPAFSAVMAEPLILDARNLLDPAALRRMGFRYWGIGRR